MHHRLAFDKTLPVRERSKEPNELGRIYLVRHGETAWNNELVFRGLAEIRLSERGQQQVALAGGALAQVSLAAIHSSPL